MPTDKLYPAYVKIEYTSLYSPHDMIRPTLAWAGAGIGDPGTFATHNESTIAGDVMVEAFIDLMMDLYYTTATSVAYTIYNVPEIGADPQPVFGKNYATPGTITVDPDDDYQAWVSTLQARTSNFGLAKVNLIEAARSGFQGKQTGALTGAYLAFFNEWSAGTNGWAGRDNGRPAVYLNTNIKPNDTLIRQYKGIW